MFQVKLLNLVPDLDPSLPKSFLCYICLSIGRVLSSLNLSRCSSASELGFSLGFTNLQMRCLEYIWINSLPCFTIIMITLGIMMITTGHREGNSRAWEKTPRSRNTSGLQRNFHFCRKIMILKYKLCIKVGKVKKNEIIR